MQTRLARAGYPVAIQKNNVETAQNTSGNNAIVVVLEALGMTAVGIALTGLVNILTLPPTTGGGSPVGTTPQARAGGAHHGERAPSRYVSKW